MKNILFLHSSAELYGSDRSLLNIVKYIDKTKFKVFVILPDNGPLVDEMQKLEDVQVDVFELAVLRRKNISIWGGIEYTKQFVQSMRYLHKYNLNNRIDLIDTNTSVIFPGAVYAKFKKIKSVWHIREIIKSNIENKVISFVMNQFADLIAANSKSTGNELNVSTKKIRVVYNAVEEIEEKNLHAKGDFIGMAGRINRWKGQKLFVDAAEKVHAIHPEVRFKIAGDVYQGEEHLKTELKKYIVDKHLENTIILEGQVDDMHAFYESLSIFVLPSIQPEPFGLVVIEAMEHKVPVIATNHGGPVEIIDHGENGFLVDYKEADEMAERITQLLDDRDLKEQIGQAGFEKKREIFSVSHMVRRIENVFEEALRG